MSSKNDKAPKTSGQSRKERRAAERAARKGRGSASGSISRATSGRAGGSPGPSMLLISIGAVLVGLVAVAALVVISGGLGGDTAAAVSEPDVPAPAGELRHGRTLGDPEAPVTIEAFEDPQCPACGAFTARIEPLLIAGPVKGGTASFTYNDFAFLGDESWDGAIAMRAAEALDGKFWDYHQVLFHNQDGENRGAFSIDRLADMAELIGLDREEFLAEMKDPEHRAAVEASNERARELGVSSTPTLIVNGELIRGVPVWEELDATIKAAAAAAEGPA